MSAAPAATLKVIVLPSCSFIVMSRVDAWSCTIVPAQPLTREIPAWPWHEVMRDKKRAIAKESVFVIDHPVFVPVGKLRGQGFS